MKVFWIVHFIPAEVAERFRKGTEFSGGWIRGMRDSITCSGEVRLSFVFKANVETVVEGTCEEGNYRYFAVPAGRYESELRQVLIREKPDVIHVWGTEFDTALQTVAAAEGAQMRERTAVSIQGLVSEIANYFTVGLPKRVFTGATPYEILRKCSIGRKIRDFSERGRAEIETLRRAAVILGRTEWDRACVEALGQEDKYRHLNENLRESFYTHRWSFDACEEHSIFVSRSDSPIKGFHFMLRALPYVAAKYPDTKLYVAGEDPTYRDRRAYRLLKSTKYGKYVGELIEEHELASRVVFTGSLNEAEMRNAFLRANVFVLPSTIENSSNSLGEAMLLGLPCVAADVGGIGSLLRHGEEGFLYQCDSPAMLAHYVCRLFSERDLAISLGERARQRALQTHDRAENGKKLIDIYRSMIAQGDQTQTETE
ncbi:MAG: glycosyltransferase family 4 protein [Oscillibacter sp.]|nr:glycosyltransferase family 4 protein [Oscillibacter sp.]